MEKLVLLFFCASFAITVQAVVPEGEVCKLARSYKLTEPNGITYFEADADGNGKSDVFLASRETQGNAGADYLIFLNDGQKLNYSGKIFLHPLALQFLYKTSILAYHRVGSSEGDLVNYQFEKNEYVRKKVERISSKELEKRLRPIKVNTVNSECTNG